MAFDDSCTGTSGPKHPADSSGTGSTNSSGCSSNTTALGTTGSGCNERPAGIPGCVEKVDGSGYCPVTTNDDQRCKPFQLTLNSDSCLIDQFVNEALNIGGAVLNVFKLLGVHEQCKTVDATGMGSPISNGDAPGYPASNAFDVFVTEWHSIQRGAGVTASAYLGYDFGEIKVGDGSRRRYGIEASVRKHITAIAIKQSSDSTKRVTRARVERSEDGIKWYGVAVVNLPDDDCLNTILFNSSVTMRYWRLRPIVFNGESTDYWGVKALQLFHNYIATNEDNIQDKIFLENRDRDYADESILLKGSYDLVDISSELSKFGIELPSQSLYLTVSFSACVAALGRPLIIGDIMEIPSEAQYSAEMRRIEKWMEVTDVAWSTEGYTPSWQPTLLRVILQPAFVSQETQDIFGDLAETSLADELGLVKNGDGENPIFQDYSDVSQEIQQQAKEMVPESGREISSTIRAWEEEEIAAAAAQGLPNLQRIGQNPTALYAEDAMPPNNAPFTEGTEFPSSPTHGDYHRMTYTGLSKDVPARLYRYSSSKGRWIFLEKDRRAEFDPNKPRLQEFLTARGRISNTEITKPNPPVCEE